MNRSECPDVSPATPELWDRIRAGLKKTAGQGLFDCPFSIYNLPSPFFFCLPLHCFV